MRARTVAGRGWCLGFACLCALAACSDPPSTVATSKPAPVTYERELATLNGAVADGLRLAERQPNDALAALETVALYAERARLTGNYDDYGKAADLLAAATARTGKVSYPCIAHARLNYSLHRLQAARAALDACPPAVALAEVSSLRADIAFQSGDYAQAERVYRDLVNEVGSPQDYVRLALYRSKTGSPGEAAALLEAAEKRYHGRSATMKAWLKLQRGLLALDRGRFDEALAMYLAASDALPGWWLVDEHIAEVKQLRGDTAGAEALYVSVVERTGSPEFMDALAEIRSDQKRDDEAQVLRARARTIYEARLAQFPEATAGHALDHFLGDSASRATALRLAEANYTGRPNGDAAVALARAQMQNGRHEDAAALLGKHIAKGWDTAEIHWVLAEALDQAGRGDAALRARAAALARNPASATMYAGAP